MNKKMLSLLLVLLMVVSLFTACGTAKPATETPPAGETPKTTEPAQEISVKKLIYSLSSEPETLDPTLNVYSKSSTVIQNLFRGLYKVGQEDKAVPALAEGYELDRNRNLFILFTLREGVKWSDGKPLTAADFEYSWKRVLNTRCCIRSVVVSLLHKEC